MRAAAISRSSSNDQNATGAAASSGQFLRPRCGSPEFQEFAEKFAEKLSKKLSKKRQIKSCVVRILVNLRWTSFLLSAFFITAAEAAPGDKMELVRDLAGRVGPVIGSALACPDIGAASNPVGDREVCGGDPGCRVQRGTAVRPRATVRSQRRGRPQRGDVGKDGLQAGGTPAGGSRTVTRPIVRAGSGRRRSSSPHRLSPRRRRPRSASEIRSRAVRGISDSEIRFGITAAFTGPVRERGRQMKLGIETAFNQVNDAGGVGGRKLRIIAADDGNEPARTLQAVQAALREGPDLRPHRQHRHRDRGGRGSLRARAADAVLRGLHRRQRSCAAILRIAMSSTTVRAMPRKPTPRCAIW